MHKKFTFFLFLTISIYISGCSLHKSASVTYGEIDNTETEEINTDINEITHIIKCNEDYKNYGKNTGHIDIMVDNNSQSFMTVPMYYQQDFPDISLGYSTVASQGNLVTCLSMIESYLSNKFITPNDFIDRYSDKYINENGQVSKKEVLDEICKTNNASYFVTKFDLDNLIEYLDIDAYTIMLDINHPSIYSDTSTYILILKNDATGKLEVRDPDYNNLEKYATFDNDNTTWYSTISICETASNSSNIYVFKKGVPDYE